MNVGLKGLTLSWLASCSALKTNSASLRPGRRVPSWARHIGTRPSGASDLPRARAHPATALGVDLGHGGVCGDNRSSCAYSVTKYIPCCIGTTEQIDGLTGPFGWLSPSSGSPGSETKRDIRQWLGPTARLMFMRPLLVPATGG